MMDDEYPDYLVTGTQGTPNSNIEYEEPAVSETGSDCSSTISVEHAIQGLLKAITFLESHPTYQQEYVKTLWDVIRYIQGRGNDIFDNKRNSPCHNTHSSDLLFIVDEPISHALELGISVKSTEDEDAQCRPILLKTEDEDAQCRPILLKTEDEDAQCRPILRKNVELDELHCTFNNSSNDKEDDANDEPESHHSDTEDESSSKVNYPTISQESIDKQYKSNTVPNVCQDCNETFENEIGFQAHVDTVHSEMAPVAKRKRHLPIITTKKKLINKRTNFASRMSKAQEPQLCTVCDKTLKSRAAFRSHIRSHNDGKGYNCEICNMLFKSACTLKSHQSKHIELKCDECGEVFHTRVDLRKHMKIHTVKPLKKFSCVHCGRSYNNGFCLQKHIGKKHTGRDSDSECVCTVCDMKFLNLIELHQHRRNERHYQCAACNEGCSTTENLITHMNTHDEKKFLCKLCERTFTNARTYVVHTKLHTGEQLHQCTECGKFFLLRSGLTSHMRQHMTERTQLCTICDSKFFLLKELKAHYRRSHTAEKRHMCTICGKRFRSAGQLIQHDKVHTGERSHICPICSKRYCSYSGMQVHIRTHTGERPSHCSVCNKSLHTFLRSQTPHGNTHRREAS